MEALEFESQVMRFKTQASFFGVRTLGDRICYVIDASDSMLTPVTEKEKKRLAAITGPPQPGAIDTPTHPTRRPAPKRATFSRA